MKFRSGIRPEIGCLQEKLIELDIGRIVANFLAREQHFQGGEEDPTGDRSRWAIDLQNEELLNDVVQKNQCPFCNLEKGWKNIFEI